MLYYKMSEVEQGIMTEGIIRFEREPKVTICVFVRIVIYLKYIWFQVNSSDSIKTIEKLISDEESMPELESVEFSSTTSMYTSYTKPKVVDEIEIYQDGLCVKQMDGEKIWFLHLSWIGEYSNYKDPTITSDRIKVEGVVYLS